MKTTWETLSRSLPIAGLAFSVLACGESPGGSASASAAQPAKGPSAAPATASTGAKSAAASTTGSVAATAPASASAPAASAAASASAAPAGKLSADGYSLDGVKTLADSCTTPWALFSTTKKGVFGIHHWPMADQAFHAHPQFKSIPGKPSAAGEVRFYAFDVDPKVSADTLLLAVECADAATCNRVGAMYKAVVPSGRLELVCAPTVPSTVGAGTVMVLSPKFHDEVPFKCARVAVCMHKLDRAITGDKHLECQKSPAGFKLDCAKKDSCEEIVACAK
jgi:hypothetical protein